MNLRCHLFALAAMCSAAIAEESPPNILFLFADDMRADTLSIAGHPLVETPTLDQLAREGVRFTHAFSQSPMCAPSRMTVLTGLSQRSHGGENPFVIHPGQARNSFPAKLRQAGYRTGFFGKVHFQLDDDLVPELFDTYQPHHRPYVRADGVHSEDLILEDSLRFLDRQDSEKPFFLSVNFNFPHAEDRVKETARGHYPWNSMVEDSLYADRNPPEPRLGDEAIFESLPGFIQRSLNRKRFAWRWTEEKYPEYMRAYLRCVTAVDRMSRRLMEKLEEKRLDGNTIIVFSSDNGYFMGNRGLAGKWSHFVESVHVPLIVYDPRLPADERGRIVDQLVSNMDFAPTFLDYAGVEIPHSYQGESLKPLAEGDSVEPERHALYLEHLLRMGSLIPKWHGVRTDDYAYAEYFEQDPPYEFLHDLKADPDELVNLAKDPDSRQVLQDMRQLTHRFQRRYERQVRFDGFSKDSKWIGLSPAFHREDVPDPSGPALGQWLRNKDTHRFLVRRAFELPGDIGIASAMLRVQADFKTEVWVNGKPLPAPASGDWMDASGFDVSSLLRPGRNQINICAHPSNTPNRFIPAVRAGLEVSFEDGRQPLEITSDGTWETTRVTWSKFNLDGGGFSSEEWLKPDFEDVEVPDIVTERHPAELRRAWHGRRPFSVEKNPARAALVVTSQGLYEPYLNGQRIAERERLRPDILMRTHRLVRSYDVTDEIASGNNVLGFFVAGGGAAGTSNVGYLTEEPPLLKAELRMEFWGEPEVIIPTGSDWLTFPAPLVEDSLAFGERYDARLEQPGWAQAGFEPEGWQPARIAAPANDLPLQATDCPPVRVVDEMEAVSLTEPKPGVHVYDFGQNASGRVRLNIRGAEPGDRIVLRYGERLAEDGTVHDGPFRDVVFRIDENAPYNVKNIDTYFCRGGETETYEPRFTYTGFRYAQVQGYPGAPGKDDLVKTVMHTDTPVTGSFECSDPLINQIWKAAQWSWRSNLMSVPTDCPTREKNSWMDVGVQVARTACWYMDSEAVLSRWLLHGMQVGGRAVGWEDMKVTLPWLLYLFYGDQSTMEACYPDMKAMVDRRIQKAKGGLYDGEGHQWLDHVALEKTDRELFCSAFYYHSLDLMSRCARVLGQEADAERYENLMPEVREAINRKFLDREAGSYRNGTQTAQLLPLAFGIVPDDLRQKVADNLAEQIRANGNRLTTGMTGTKFLLPVLTENGHFETAWALAKQTGYPSWGHMINNGATTMWEMWSASPERVRDSDSLISSNHPNFGSVGEWFFESLAGITPDPRHPGFEHFTLRPHIPQDLESAGAEFLSPHGTIVSRWKKKDDGMVAWQVSIPAGTSAAVEAPPGFRFDDGQESRTLQPGEFAITLKPE